jgi:hypothetical protein
MGSYATPDDVGEFDSSLTLPTNIDRLISIASDWVADATRLALYDVDAEGYPTGPNAIAGFKGAVCAQVAAWVSNGVDPTKLATSADAGRVVSSKTLNPVGSVTYDTTADVADAQRIAGLRLNLCDEAVRKLRLAGLLNVGLVSW